MPVAGNFGVPGRRDRGPGQRDVAGSSAGGNIAVAPSFGTTVGTSTLCYAKGDTVANRPVAQLAADGTIEVYASTQSHVRIDLLGWFGTGGEALHFNPVRPGQGPRHAHRDGRGGHPLRRSAGRLTVAGLAGIAADAHSVVATLTVIHPIRRAPTRRCGGPATPSPTPRTSAFPRAAPGTGLVTPELSTSGGKASLEVAAGTADATLAVLGYFR